MNPKFKVGDLVYVPNFRPHATMEIPCSVCAGNKVVHLILGSGETVELPCAYCTKGWQEPTGMETVYGQEVDARLVTITGITITANSVEYHSTSWVIRECYATREEALEAAQVLADEYNRDQLTRADNLKKQQRKNYSWNAGYHLSKARRHERDAARHQDRAKLCQERARKPEEEE